MNWSGRKEGVFFTSSDGLTLEGEKATPQVTPRGSVVLAHPHPLYGGNKDNNVVTALWQALPQAGFLTFRFNFRGVGASEGRFEEGIGEVRDLAGAVRFLRDVEPGDLPCFLVGYSFGAYVIHRLNPLPATVRGIVMISPPVSMSDFKMRSFKVCPTLVLAGDQDLFCRPDDLEEMVRSLKGESTLKIFPGRDHFWFGRENELITGVQTWLETRVKGVS